MHYLKNSLFTFLAFAFCSPVFSQVELVIKITPDGFGQDISWELQTQDHNSVVASGDLAGCLPNEECEVYREEVEDRCYTLLLKDSNGDGIAMPGGYEIFYNGALAVSGREFESRIYHNFNCTLGETCENPIVLSLPNNDIYAPDTKEFWFEFTPPEDGYYRVNSCLNFLTGTGYADTKLWMYDTCDRSVHQSGAEGALGYSEFSSECAPAAGFNFVPLEGDKTYYIRHKPMQDWININHGDSLELRFQKLPVRSGCIDVTACNYDPFAQVDNGTCEYNVTCLPDLSLDEQYLRESIEVDTVFNNDECFIDEGCLRGPGAREVIRFSTKIDNVGDADYVVGIPENDTILFDRNNCHGHYHHQGYAEYLIYRGDGQPEPVGFKSGFCVLDLDCSDAPGTLPKYLCANMGITQGCSDIYEAYLDCQWIDITDLEDGQYSIVVRVNHFRLADARGFQEKTYDNNAGQACVTIDRSSGKLVVTLDTVCPEYEDCLGVAGGDAVLDCNSECGGTAHYGDLDDTGELEQGDLDLYMDMLLNKIELDGPCHDLNADGDLSIYDAVLTYDCILEKEENIDNPFHSHCNFPAGNDVASEYAMMRVSEFNITDNYLDLELWVGDRNISGYQINTEGIIVTEVERLYTTEPDAFMWNDEELFALHATQEFERNTAYEPFLRIHYSEMTADSICITTQSEFVNNSYDRITTLVDNACYYISSTEDVLVASDFTIHPNPAKHMLTVIANGEYVKSYQITDVDGKELGTRQVESATAFDVKISDLQEGLYILQLKMDQNKVLTKRFVKI